MKKSKVDKKAERRALIKQRKKERRLIKKKKTTIQYKLGKKDAYKMLKQYSLWLVSAMCMAWGLARKQSMDNVELWLYCEGWNDAIDRVVKRRGLSERGQYGYLNCKDIGKGDK
jgi:hypothetical protein